MHWLLHFFGLDSASGPAYLAWSGALSDLGELAIIGGMITLWRRHTCAVRGCWRIGRHQVSGTQHICCGRHTPGGAPTHAHILAMHRRHRQRLAQAPGEARERLYDRERDGL